MVRLLISVIVLAAVGVYSANNCGWRPSCWETELACQYWSTHCNGDMCKVVCDRMALDKNLAALLSLQRELQRRKPFDQVHLIGTHNSYISPANGIGLEEDYSEYLLRQAGLQRPEVVIANHRLSLTDQLRLGVRHLELDIHHLSPVTGDEVRLCHWDVTPPQFPILVQLLHYKLYYGRSRLHWDWTRVGCSRKSDPLSKGLWEIRHWLDENPREFVTIYLDNRVPRFRFNYTVGVLNQVFGTRLMSPKLLRERFQGQWPSIETLTLQGFQVSVENNDNFKWAEHFPVARELLFLKGESWVEFDIFQFRPFPDCSVSLSPPSAQRQAVRGDGQSDNGIIAAPFSPLRVGQERRMRLLDNSNMLGPSRLFDMTKAAVDSSALPALIRCGVNILSLDQITPAVAAQTIWTFELDASMDRQDGCVSLDLQTTKWKRQKCELVGSYLCQHQATNGGKEWRLAENKGPAVLHENHTTVMCPDGYVFSLPRNAQENFLAVRQITAATAAAAAGVKRIEPPLVWLAFDENLIIK